MNPEQIDKMLRAQDIYPVWKKRIRDAEKTITVFSPFLNGLLVELLTHNDGIAPADILVITDFRHAALLDHHPAQLHAIKALLDRGIGVRSLSLLHAKILLTDNEHVVLGSQNFTFQGRKNKEAAFISAVTAQDSRFMKDLLDWADQAEPVDPDRVNRLIELIDPLANRLKKAKTEIEAELDAIVTAQEREQKAEHKRRLDEQERNSTVRLASGAVFASIGPVGSSENGLYSSLLVERGYNLTKWEAKSKTGTWDPTSLDRLSFHPLLITDTQKMGYARIAKTRISFIWDSANRRKPLKLGHYSFGVHVCFPSYLPVMGNIKITLSCLGKTACEFYALFNGTSFNITTKHFIAVDNSGIWRTTLEKELFSSHDALTQFFRDYFSAFRGGNFVGETLTMSGYFGEGRYRLSLIQYDNVPILLARKC